MLAVIYPNQDRIRMHEEVLTTALLGCQHRVQMAVHLAALFLQFAITITTFNYKLP